MEQKTQSMAHTDTHSWCFNRGAKETQWRKDSLSTSGVEQSIDKKVKPDLRLRLYTKINLKWFMDLNVEHKTTKRLVKHIGENFSDLRLGKPFLDLTPKNL